MSSGYVAIVGRPNVGKSTLLNQLLGQKISITTHKPQTTRHRILGIKTTPDAQVIYVDTPGIHDKEKRAINRYMNREASSSITDVDVVVFLVDGLKWLAEDELVLQKVASSPVPVILGINKLDNLKDKALLLPYLQKLSQKMSFAQLVPLSARTGQSVDVLEQAVIALLPPTEQVFFPEDQITDRNGRFMAAEFIREKLMRTLGEELPYELTVEIEKFEQDGKLARISGVIWVERPGQKGIIIGKNGQQLKRIGEQARKDLEQLFDCKVFLQLWVKVKQGWADDERALRSLGYTDDYQ